MLMNMSGEAPIPWAYAGVTNIEVLLNFENSRQFGGPLKFGRNIVGKVANATARRGKSAAFPACWAVLEHDREEHETVSGKDHAPTKGCNAFRARRNRRTSRDEAEIP
jgi:hypothetical protein